MGASSRAGGRELALELEDLEGYDWLETDAGGGERVRSEDDEQSTSLVSILDILRTDAKLRAFAAPGPARSEARDTIRGRWVCPSRNDEDWRLTSAGKNIEDRECCTSPKAGRRCGSTSRPLDPSGHGAHVTWSVNRQISSIAGFFGRSKELAPTAWSLVSPLRSACTTRTPEVVETVPRKIGARSSDQPFVSFEHRPESSRTAH